MTTQSEQTPTGAGPADTGEYNGPTTLGDLASAQMGRLPCEYTIIEGTYRDVPDLRIHGYRGRIDAWIRGRLCEIRIPIRYPEAVQ